MISRLKLYAIAAGAFLVALVAAYLDGRAKGSATAVAKQAAAERQAAQTAKGVEDAVNKLNDSDVSSRLNKWMRD